MKKFSQFINKTSSILFSFSRSDKIIILTLIDLVFVFISIYTSSAIYNNQLILNFSFFSLTLVLSAIFYLPIFFLIGFYKNLVRFLSIKPIINLTLAIIIYGVIFYFFNYYYSDNNNFLIFTIIHSLLFFNLVLFSRLFAILLYRSFLNSDTSENMIIYGAGEAGNLILIQNTVYNIVCFVDDDLNKAGRKINNLNIFHTDELQRVIEKYNAKIILIAIPSLDIVSRNKIISFCSTLDVSIKITPSFNDLITGKANINDYKYISSDLLNRNINWNTNSINKYISGKKILITGAGGSIGGELSRQIIKYLPSQLFLLDNNEFNLFKIMNEIKLISLSKNDTREINIQYSLVNISDYNSLNNLFKDFIPDIIFHAAAFKHVPILENNKFQALQNNIIATYNLIKLSINNDIKKFIFISTDKAIKPSSIMGCSKRISELLMTHSNKNNPNNKVAFSIVRFGNVINSHGSVIPIFNEQIKNGGPLTVTHPEVTRYFMSIPEAVGLVLEVSTFSKHGEKFILNMGNPIKILDIAKKMIKLSGEQLYDNQTKIGIQIKFIGLRKGEKMHEELSQTNNFSQTKNKHIFKDNSQDSMIDYNELLSDLDTIYKNYNDEKLISYFKKYIDDNLIS